MRLNRRVPVGTHGGVRGRLSYLFRGASYSIVIGNPLNDGKWTYTWENGRQLARMQSIDTDA